MNELIVRNAGLLTVALRLLILACAVSILYFCQALLIPVALASLVAFALNPAVRRLVEWRFPRPVAVGIVTLVFLSAAGGVFWFIGEQVRQLGGQLPSYRANIVEKVRAGKKLVSGGMLEEVRQTVEEVAEEAAKEKPSSEENTPESASQFPNAPLRPLPGQNGPAKILQESDSMGEWMSRMDSLTGPLSTLGLVLILVVIFLLQWSELRARLLGLVSANVFHTTLAIADAGSRIGRYLFYQLLYNVGFGVVAGLGLWFLGVPYAPLWGLCAALFRYVPYMGPVAAAMLPIAVSLITSEGWTQVLSVVAFFTVLELLSNNLVEPRLYGRNLGVSEIGIILSSVAWAWVWGPAGLLLATPLTVCLVVLGTHVPALGFLAKALGNKKILSGPQEIYQRLLAGDSFEVSEIVRRESGRSGKEVFLTETLLPTLALARRDQAFGWLASEAEERLMDGVKVALEELDDVSGVPTQPDATGDRNGPGKGNPAIVALWSVCPVADALLPLLSRAVNAPTDTVVTIESRELVGGTFERLAEMRVAAIVFVFLSEVDTSRAAGLAKRATRRFTSIQMQALRLGGIPFAPEEKELFRSISVGTLVSLSAGMAWISSFAETGPGNFN